MINVLITGVSSGIGHALAKHYLESGACVYGLSRRHPPDLIAHPRFRFCPVDLAVPLTAQAALQRFLLDTQGLTVLDYAFLNAGRFSQRIARVSDVRLADIQQLMDINVWANKTVLDVLLHGGVSIRNCIFSASIAGVRARAGNSGYALSKATLNMLAKLYALEHPDVFFAAIGLCSVDTALSQDVLSLPIDGNFPAIANLRQRNLEPDYLASPQQRAYQLDQLLQGPLQKLLESGDFVEIRSLLA